MKVTVEDDRPALVPVLLTALVAGLVSVLVAGALRGSGAGGGVVTLLAVAVGLFSGLLLQDRVARWYGDWRGLADDPVEDGGGDEPPAE